MVDSLPLSSNTRENKLWKGIFALVGIMSTLVIYGVLQEKIMRVPYGANKEYFKFSLFLVFCNRITTYVVSAVVLVARKKALDPVAPVYKYCLILVSNILTTTCQYEALKYVSFPVQTLAKCAKMIPVMIWGTVIMQKKYKGMNYLKAFLVTLGCSIFILFSAGIDVSPYSRGRENTIWGVSLMLGYLRFDGFTSTFQDKLFRWTGGNLHSCYWSLENILVIKFTLLGVFKALSSTYELFFGFTFFELQLISSLNLQPRCCIVSYTCNTLNIIWFYTFKLILSHSDELHGNCLWKEKPKPSSSPSILHLLLQVFHLPPSLNQALHRKKVRSSSL
ncbi:hypothetical protein K2173_024025 [Erythroxylum novogranatense]|uniref:Uncharacterized protein n=1 Tax=Erythroxylum novogranatense TaxID=1862640 RepID=A0AAV8TSH1_9ROSI|nr:hypothetical protein K2173_024025 [Erythroxylum novogranatense]